MVVAAGGTAAAAVGSKVVAVWGTAAAVGCMVAAVGGTAAAVVGKAAVAGGTAAAVGDVKTVHSVVPVHCCHLHQLGSVLLGYFF